MCLDISVPTYSNFWFFTNKQYFGKELYQTKRVLLETWMCIATYSCGIPFKPSWPFGSFWSLNVSLLVDLINIKAIEFYWKQSISSLAVESSQWCFWKLPLLSGDFCSHSWNVASDFAGAVTCSSAQNKVNWLRLFVAWNKLWVHNCLVTVSECGSSRLMAFYHWLCVCVSLVFVCLFFLFDLLASQN